MRENFRDLQRIFLKKKGKEKGKGKGKEKQKKRKKKRSGGGGGVKGGRRGVVICT